MQLDDATCNTTIMARYASFIYSNGNRSFAYTPILPFMQVSEHMDSAQAGFLATINYLGT